MQIKKGIGSFPKYFGPKIAKKTLKPQDIYSIALAYIGFHLKMSGIEKIFF